MRNNDSSIVDNLRSQGRGDAGGAFVLGLESPMKTNGAGRHDQKDPGWSQPELINQFSTVS